ncbi:transglycosylase SLT domain-containing protein [Nocardia blacklockiae]|nr:transglycosylase SLT domain-containing protein [Nocardia blacklockiae]
MAAQLKDDQKRKQEYLDHLNDLDKHVADIAKKSAGISDQAYRDVKAMEGKIQKILDDVKISENDTLAYKLQRQYSAIVAIDGVVEETESTVNDAHQRLTNQSVGMPQHSGTTGGGYAPAAARVPHNSSGGYDGGYTQRVSSVSGSTEKNMLNDEQLRAHIKEALKALGITDPVAVENWTRGYLTLISRESGSMDSSGRVTANAGAINLTDSNATAGHPSQGLTQTIPSTFEAYHVQGTSNVITDPTANIAASMNYVMHRYDVSRDGSNLAANVQQANPNASPKGY